MKRHVMAMCVTVTLCAAVTSSIHAQNPNPSPPPSPGPKTATSRGMILDASTLLKCDKFTQHIPKELLGDATIKALWDQYEWVNEFRECVDAEHGDFDQALNPLNSNGAGSAASADPRKVHDRLAGEFLTLRHMARWYTAFTDSYKRTKDKTGGHKVNSSAAEPDRAAELTRVFLQYQYAVRRELTSHGLEQPFSGVLKAGAAIVERGSSVSTTPQTTEAGQLTPSGTATNTGQSPIAHIDFESKHFGADRGFPVDASFTTTVGFQPALSFLKPAAKTLGGTDNTKTDPSTAYQSAFVFSVGGNLHVSTFHAGEVSLSGRLGAVNLTNNATVVDQGTQSYIAVPFGSDNTRLFGELGVHANLYRDGIDMAHLEKSSLTPLFHIEAGIREDPRFSTVGDSYYLPTRRTYFRVSAENVPVLDQINPGSKVFSLAFAWEYDGPWFKDGPAGTIKIPSGNRFVIRGDINLLKALRPDVAGTAQQKTHDDKKTDAPAAPAPVGPPDVGPPAVPAVGTVPAGAIQVLAIDVMDATLGHGVVAHVKMNENPSPIERDTDHDGHIEFNLVAGPRDFLVTAEGFQSEHVNVDNSCTGNPPCSGTRTLTVKLQPTHFNPAQLTDDQLRAFAGSLAGIYLDAIKPQCPEDPTTHIRCQADNGATPHGLVDGALFTANYRLYTAGQRKAIRDAYAARNYTHFPISIFTRDGRDYHGVYPAIATAATVGLNEALHELYDNDGRSPLIPVCFVMSDDEPNDATTPLRLPVDFDHSLCRIVVAYWEHYETDCAMAKVHAAFPAALQYYHNPVNTDAGYGDACWPGKDKPYPGGFAWYAHARSAYGLRGLLLQTGEGSFDETVGRIADFTASFGAGLRADSGVVGLDVVWFEDTKTVYDNFWGGGNEQQNLQRADQVLKFMTTPLCEDDQRRVVTTSRWCGVIKGFGSGGTVRR